MAQGESIAAGDTGGRRAIKFRAWDTQDERFIFPDLGYQGHYCVTLNGDFVNLQNGSGGQEYTIQQFTGVQDSDGTNVYEGDIVDFSDQGIVDKPVSGLAEVLWVSDRSLVSAPQWGLWFLGDGAGEGQGFYRSMDGQMKVCGNIFQGVETSIGD
jgi:hypothetical protein